MTTDFRCLSEIIIVSLIVCNLYILIFNALLYLVITLLIDTTGYILVCSRRRPVLI